MPYTPGPWEARTSDGQIVLNGSNCYDIREIYNDQGGFNPDDIRLMGAAPDLLAVCKDIAGDMQAILDGDDFSGMSDAELFGVMLRSLNAAISKAEGRG